MEKDEVRVSPCLWTAIILIAKIIFDEATEEDKALLKAHCAAQEEYMKLYAEYDKIAKRESENSRKGHELYERMQREGFNRMKAVVAAGHLPRSEQSQGEHLDPQLKHQGQVEFHVLPKY